MSEKKKIAIIGASEFQNALILKAKEMGYETHVFAWQAGAVGESTADHFYPISITEKEAILDECRRLRPEGIASIGSDLAVHTVCYVSEKLGLCSNRFEDMAACTNKYEMRRRFAAAGLYTPAFLKAEPGRTAPDASALRFPAIVKPTDRSGSRGITKVFSPAELPAAIALAQENSFEHGAIVEEFIDGPEYSFESISFQGRHHFLAVTKKYTTGAPHFIETGHDQPSGLSAGQVQKAIDTVFPALDALHIRNGASHAEFRINADGDICLIEIGARMGGDCIGSDLVQISTGYDFVRMVIDVACGRAPVFERVNEPMLASVRFIFRQSDLDELRRIEREEPQSIWRVSHIDAVGSHPITDSSNRYGFYITARPLRT